MPINFPPGAPGATHSAAGVNWLWDGEKWVSQSTDEASLWQRDGDTLKPTNDGDDVQVGSLNGGPLAGLRNVLINGDFRLWQRGAGPTAPNATGVSYLADRWTVRGTGGSGGTPTVQFQWGPNKEYSMHRYNATGLTSGSYVEQRVEAYSVRPLINKQLTVSVYSSHPVAISLYYYDSANALQTIIAEESMDSEGNNRYSYTFTMPNATVASFSEDTGLIVRFHYNNAASPLADGSYDIWNAQLECGPVATPFEARPIALERQLCQRYYQTISRVRLSAENTGGTGNPGTGGTALTTTMRSAPTLEGSYSNCSERSVDISTDCINFRVNGTANNSVMSVSAITLDAEL